VRATPSETIVASAVEVQLSAILAVRANFGDVDLAKVVSRVGACDFTRDRFGTLLRRVGRGQSSAARAAPVSSTILERTGVTLGSAWTSPALGRSRRATGESGAETRYRYRVSAV
jgi:hypothetical protein